MAAMAGSLIGVALAVPTVSSACENPDPQAAQQVFSGINTVRASRGLERLVRSPLVNRPAAAHSQAMARSDSIWHDDLTRWARGRSVAQNVAYGATGRQALSAMLRSTPHRRNILSGRYRLVGVGAARSCTGVVMVSVDFMSAR
jgi:uncharacterized protein YkwD